MRLSAHQSQSEPERHPAKEQHQSEKNERSKSCAFEGIFAPRWHVKLVRLIVRLVNRSASTRNLLP